MPVASASASNLILFAVACSDAIWPLVAAICECRSSSTCCREAAEKWISDQRALYAADVTTAASVFCNASGYAQ